jgi:hypothetical protein
MDVYTSIMTTTIPITVALLLISASIYALVYMVSKFFGNDKLRKWVEGEFHQSFATALFLFLSVGFIAMFINLSGIFMTELIILQDLDSLYDYMIQTNRETTGVNDFDAMYDFDKPLFTDDDQKDMFFGSDSHMVFARVFLLNQLDRLNSLYTIYFWTDYTVGTIFTVFFSASGQFLGGFFTNTVASFKQSILSYLFYGFFFTYMQLALLDLIQVFFFFMFPAGIFLRAFTFTNSVGSAMIAISVGLYFIYPTILGILLITNYQELDLSENNLIRIAMADEPSDFLNYQLQVRQNFEQVKPPSMGERFISVFTQTSEIMGSFVNVIVLHMFLLPMVSFTLTYTFIHAFSGFMQANVSEMGRGLIRLI